MPSLLSTIRWYGSPPGSWLNHAATVNVDPASATAASARTCPTWAWSLSPSRCMDGPVYRGGWAQPARESVRAAAIARRAFMGWVEYAPFGRLDGARLARARRRRSRSGYGGGGGAGA